MDFNIGRMKAEAMAKAFGVEIEKARVGVYEDNAENRRLNRVGQAYGKKKQEEAPKDKPKYMKETITDEELAKETGIPIDRIKQLSDDERKRIEGNVRHKWAVKDTEEWRNSPEREKEVQRLNDALKGKLPNGSAKKKQRGGDIGKQAATASDGALKRAAADPKAAPEVKQAAQAEMKKRGGTAAEDDKKDSKRGGNSATKELAAILDPLDSWSDDDWNDADKNAELFSQIRSVISKYDMSEQEFFDATKKYQGLDLVYTDYAPHDKIIPIAKEKIRTELKKFDSFSDDDWNDPDKQQKITDKLTFYIRHYDISEDEWDEIVKPYAEGLSGLPYSDFQ